METQEPNITGELQIISSSDALSAVTSAEIDKQIATAHQYPRNVASCMQNITALALLDEDIAGSCYYHLERTDKNGEKAIIEGPSIRLAEIVAANWGNLRIGTRVVGNDGRMVTVEAVCHDLESNVAVSQQQVRSIVTRNGKTYSNDMQTLTINAASAIALRNAINKVIPMAITRKVVEQCKSMVRGKAAELPEKRQKLVAAFASIGVSREQLLAKLGIASVDEITADMVVSLRGLYTSLKDGNSTVEEEFPRPAAPTEEQSQTQTVAAKARDAVKKSQQGGKQQPPVQPNINFDQMSDEEIERMGNNL